MTGITMELCKASNRSLIWLPSWLLCINSRDVDNTNTYRQRFKANLNDGFCKKAVQASCVPVSVANDWYKTLVIAFIVLFITGFHVNFHFHIHSQWWLSYCQWLNRNPEAFLYLYNTTPTVSLFNSTSYTLTPVTSIASLTTASGKYHPPVTILYVPPMFMNIFVIILSACTIWLLLLAVTSDPGLYQQDTESCIVEVLPIKDGIKRACNIKALIPEDSSSVVVDGKECHLPEKNVECKLPYSEQISVFSVQFCRHCDAFVCEFDHHCGFLGICIGKYNFGLFLMTLWLIGTSALCYAALNIYFLIIGSFFSEDKLLCPVSVAIGIRASFPIIRSTSREDIQLFCYDLLSLFVPLLSPSVPLLANEAPPRNLNILCPVVISVVCVYLGMYAFLIWAIYAHAAWKGRQSVVHRIAYDIKDGVMSGSVTMTPQQMTILHHVYGTGTGGNGYHFHRDKEPINSYWRLAKCMVLSLMTTRTALIVN